MGLTSNINRRIRTLVVAVCADPRGAGGEER
jgi:hypothetical protein